MRDTSKLRPLGALCQVLDCKRKPITKRHRVQGQYPYYGATGILDYVDGFIFDERLILIGEDGAKWGAGENTAFAADGKYWVNNHTHVIRPYRDTVVDEWLIYYLNAADLSPFITGLTVPKLNQGKLLKIPIPVPLLSEQKRIVAILDEAFEGIAVAFANAEKNLANARELFESYLDSVFTQKGEGWVKRKLGEVCTLKSGTTVNKNLEKSSGDVPYLKVADMTHICNESQIVASSRFLNIGDIRSNTIFPAGTTIFPKRGGAILTNKKRLTAVPICTDLKHYGRYSVGRSSSNFSILLFSNGRYATAR